MVTASIRRLQVFKTVVERAGINAAATHLGVSQPSVTAHIRALETQTGTPLIIRQRGRRHLRLSPAGEQLYQYACEAILKAQDNGSLRPSSNIE